MQKDTYSLSSSVSSVLPSNFQWTHGLWVFAGFTLFFSLFFSPILFQGFLFGEGDGLVYYLPAFLSSPQLWSDLIFAGYPVAADPQMMTWYPPAMLLRWIPGSWNCFIVLAYAMAASFAYCYCFVLTRSRLAAICSGLVYGLSGFVLGHLSHVTMVHAAAWIPLILAVLERLRQGFDRRWWVIGIGAVACCWLGGHPQISVYGVGLGAIYALVMGWNAPIGRGRYYLAVTSIFTIGLMFCAIQILPTWQLSQRSVRSEMTFESFTTYSLPGWQAIHMLFPYLFGGARLLPYEQPYWGQWFLIEIFGCVGLMPLMLAAIGLVGYRPRRVVMFWVAVGLIAFLLAMGSDTPLASLLYRVPAYNKFRAQGRHLVEVAVAASALTGLGVATIVQRGISRRSLSTIVGLSGVGMLGAWIWLVLHQESYQQLAVTRLGSAAQLNFWPWQNPAIGIPLLTWGLSAMALLLWSRHRRVIWMSWILCAALLWDVSSFSWFWSWQPPAAQAQFIQSPPAAKFFHDRLAGNHQRLLTSQGSIRSGNDRLIPNMTRVWQLPNASGYTPLILSRVGQMLQMNYGGVVGGLPSKVNDRSLDLMAIRYVLVPPPIPLATTQGLHWTEENLPLAVGNGACATTLDPVVRLEIPQQQSAVSAIGIVSSLSCAPSVPNNTEIAQIQAIGVDGRIAKASIKTGRDTAEWAYDCSDVKPTIKHQRAPVFKTVPVVKPGASSCNSNSYASVIALDRSQKIKQLVIQSTSVAGVPSIRLDIQKLLLLDETKQQSSQISAFGLAQNFDGTPRWQTVANLDGTTVYENKLAMPRTWLVSELIRTKPEEMLPVIQNSQLPDGRSFDPARMALVENSLSQKLPDLQPTDIAKVVTIVDTQIKIQTDTASSAFLVLSDVDYPGWQVTIDGQAAPLLQVNYIQRGVQVPAGRHLIGFAFRPRMFRAGVAGSLVAILTTAIGFWWLGRSGRVSPFL